jgi:gliding motility-associated-like protein
VLRGSLPEIIAFPQIDTLCTGESSTLRAYTSDSLIWSPDVNISSTSEDTVIVNPSVTTQYIATALSTNGCKSYDTVLVKVYSPISLSVTPPVSTICPETPLQLNASASGKISWTPSTYLNNSSIPDPISIPSDSITYTVIAQDSVGCFADTATAVVNVYSRPEVEAGPDLFLPYNSAFTLSPVYSTGLVDYSWTPPGNLSCTDCQTPHGLALDRQSFIIEVTDQNSCKGKDSVTVFVSCEKSNLLLPGAFTPNGDGRNDWFYPITFGYKQIKSFVIFNRLGGKVFERKTFMPNIESLGWDGRVKNSGQPDTQAFIWILEGECHTGESIITKGSVILLR